MDFFYDHLYLSIPFLALIFLLFKKYANTNLNLKKSEEEIILVYSPISLVEDIPFRSEHRIVKGKVGEFINLDGIKCINFATHDYFGFVGKKRIEDKAIESIEKYAVGSCGPRSFYGTNIVHLNLEMELADFLGTESSIIYPLGFTAVASAIPAYAKKQDIILVDEKSNFAIRQGTSASASKIISFTHNNPEHLRQILKKIHPGNDLNTNNERKSVWILVLEGIYFNTGEICHLPEFLQLSRMFKLRVFIDESISFGTLGINGRGVLEHFGIPRAEVDLTMGSFEHSLASGGVFCAGSKYIIEQQVLSGKGYCFSAALPPCLVTAASEALDMIKEDQKLLVLLQICCQDMHEQLKSSRMINRYFSVSGAPNSPIHVLTLRDSRLSQQLLKNKDKLLDDIVESCRKKNMAIVKASSLKTDDAPQISLRITTSVYHSSSRIRHLVTTLEQLCEWNIS